MPKRSSPGVMAGEDSVAGHVQQERELRGWSTAELARRVTEAGCPISQSAVWRIESGSPRRKISVDELIGFAKVFEMQIQELLEPIVTEYPEDLIRLYVNKWVDAERYIRALQARSSVDLFRLISASWIFPAARQWIRGAIVDRVVEKEGMIALSRDYVEKYAEAFAMQQQSEDHTPVPGLAEIILLGRGRGMSDAEIADEAGEWGVREMVEEAIGYGVVHHVEPDFAGYISIESLEIRDGKVVTKAGVTEEERDRAERIAKKAKLR